MAGIRNPMERFDVPNWIMKDREVWERLQRGQDFEARGERVRVPKGGE